MSKVLPSELFTHPFSYLNYGETKVGKTHLAIRAVHELGGLVLDTEGRWSSLSVRQVSLAEVGAVLKPKNPDWQALHDLLSASVIYIEPPKYERALDIVNALRAAKDALGTPLVPLIVFDGWTEFQESAIAGIGRRTAGTSSGTDDPRLLSRQGWGILYREEIDLQMALSPAATGAILYATASVAEKDDPLEPATSYLAPDLQGQFGTKVKRRYDVLSYMRKIVPKTADDPVIRRLYFQSIGKFIAGHIWESQGCLPNSLDNTDLLDILERLAKAKYWEVAG